MHSTMWKQSKEEGLLQNNIRVCFYMQFVLHENKEKAMGYESLEKNKK